MMNFIKKIFKEKILSLSLKSKKNVHLKHLLKEKCIIAESTIEEDLMMEKSLKYSMTPKVRMWALVQSIKYLINNNIEGDIVETGVYKGGNLILAKKLLNFYEPNSVRNIFGYDTFEGMTKPSSNDKDLFGEDPHNTWKQHQKDNINEWCYSSLEDVKKNFYTETSSIKSLKLVKGPVEKTLKLKENLPNKISLLRLDTDWYESSKIELEILYPRLVNGGVLILDDYGHWLGVKKAVDQYFINKKIWLHYIDYGCRLLIK